VAVIIAKGSKQERFEMKKITKIQIVNLVVPVLVLIALSCVTDRQTRTEIYNENVYVDKQFLTRENPNKQDEDDFGWLYNLTVTGVSTPNVLGDWLFPGLELWPTLGYVRFQLMPDSMQMVSGIELMEGDFPDVLPRVVTEWPGEHVDLQLRQNLDGERTNYREENKERPWQSRQFFKVKFDEATLDDVHTLSWVYDYYVDQCATVTSVSLVPDSFEYVDSVAQESNMCSTSSCHVDWEKGDYMSWRVQATFEINPIGPCATDLMSWAMDAFTTNVEFKYTFWRKPADPEGYEYVEREIKEKDNYRKKFGIFEALQVYNDPETLLTGATFKMARFNPNIEHTYYFVDGFPDKYKDIFHQIAEDTNAVMEKAGVGFRVRYAEHDEDGIPRTFGDVRYSFVSLHRNQYTTFGLLGYGPPHIDPRTGEVVSGSTNLYDFGFQYYTFLMRDFLEQVSDAFDDLEEGGDPLPEPCTPGEMVPVLTERVKAELESTTLYNKPVSYTHLRAHET